MSWPLVSLGELCTLENGDRGVNYPSKGSFVDVGVPFINAGNLRDWSVNKESLNFITDELYNLLSNGKVRGGDILYCLRGSIGKFAIVRDIVKGAIASSLVIIRPNEKLSLDYLSFYLGSILCEREIEKYENGAAQPNLSAKDLKQFQIPLPPLDTQKQIAAVLEKADQLRKDCQKMEQELNNLAQSVFIDMFGDPMTNPKGWEPRVLKEFYESEKTGTKCGPFGSALKKDEFVDSGVPVWNMSNITLNGKFIDGASLWITEEKFKDLASYSVNQGDVIISRAGTVGKMGVVSSKFNRSIISTNLIRVRFGENLHPLYFVSLMTYFKTRLKRLKVGDDGSFSHMNTGILDTLEFPYPPIEEQLKYIAFRERLESQVAQVINLKGEYETSFNSLIIKALKGELSLKPSKTKAA